jgi:hypothetical protein
MERINNSIRKLKFINGGKGEKVKEWRSNRVVNYNSWTLLILKWFGIGSGGRDRKV